MLFKNRLYFILFWLNHILLPPHPLQPTPNREPSSLLEWPSRDRGRKIQGGRRSQFLIPANLLIEFLLHLVDEIGTAGILAQFDGRIVAVALLGVEPEELVEGRGEHLQGCLAVGCRLPPSRLGIAQALFGFVLAYS